jgi:hypothetical protein
MGTVLHFRTIRLRSRGSELGYEFTYQTDIDCFGFGLVPVAEQLRAPSQFPEPQN